MTFEAFPDVYLTTVDALKVWLRTDAAAEANHTAANIAINNEILLQAVRQASADVVAFLQRLPLPYLATNTYDYARGTVSQNGQLISLPDDLLAVTEFTLFDTTTPVPTANYVIQPYNSYPKTRIHLKGHLCRTPPNICTGSWLQAITIEGEWGYVPQYGNHWAVSGAALAADLSATATAATLGTNQGALFEIGQYIRIQDEYLLVTGTATSSITVERAQLGTTAAIHLSSSTIDVFIQHSVIQRNTTEWAAYLYKQRPNIGAQVFIYEDGTKQVNGLSPLVKEALNTHARLGGASFAMRYG